MSKTNKRKLMILAVITLCIAMYFIGPKLWKKYNFHQLKKKLEQTEIKIDKKEIDFQTEENESVEVYGIDEDLVYFGIEIDNITQSFNVLNMKDGSIEVIKDHLNLPVEEFAIYQDQPLYIYEDENSIEHLIYEDQDIYQSEDQVDISLYNGENIYLFVSGTFQDDMNKRFNSIYLFDGKLEEIWTEKTQYYTGPLLYKGEFSGHMVFMYGSCDPYTIYYEENGEINSYTTENTYNFSLVHGGYMMSLYSSDYRDYEYSIFNLNTGKETEVDVKYYHDGKYYSQETSSNGLYYYPAVYYGKDLGNHMFIFEDDGLLFKGIVDEKNGIVLFMNATGEYADEYASIDSVIHYDQDDHKYYYYSLTAN